MALHDMFHVNNIYRVILKIQGLYSNQSNSNRMEESSSLLNQEVLKDSELNISVDQEVHATQEDQ